MNSWQLEAGWKLVARSSPLVARSCKPPAFALCAVLAACAPSGAPWDGDTPPREAYESQVRAIYDSVTTAARASGADFSLRVRNLRDIDSTDWDSVRYGEILTLPDGPSIATRRATVGGNHTLLPGWDDGSTWLLTDPGSLETTGSMTLNQIIALYPESGRKRIDRIFSFRVRVRLEGRERTYRAAAVFLRDPGCPPRLISIADFVVQGTGELTAERQVALAQSTCGR